MQYSYLGASGLKVCVEIASFFFLRTALHAAFLTFLFIFSPLNPPATPRASPRSSRICLGVMMFGDKVRIGACFARRSPRPHVV